MDAKRERERLMDEISRFDWYFLEVRKTPMPKALSEDRAERGFTEIRIYLPDTPAEGLLEDVLSAGEEQGLGVQILDRLHRFLEEYTDLLKQEAFWCE